jgi:uncharacterized membrane protein YgcG
MRTPSQSRFTRFRRPAWVAALLAALLLPLGVGAERPEDLRPQGYVSDFAGVLSSRTKAKLANLCREVDHKAGAQIAIVTVKSRRCSDRAVQEGSSRETEVHKATGRSKPK